MPSKGIFQAAEFRTAWMIDLDSDLLILRIEVHVTNRPRGRQAKNVLVEFFVLHLGGPLPSNSTITHTSQFEPTNSPEQPTL
jgi:hypothetical protein